MQDSDEVLVQANEQQASMKAAKEAAEAAGEKIEEVENPIGFRLAGKWLTGLVLECPTIEGMIDLVSTPTMRPP